MSSLSLSLFLFACVTINIYFPAEKVESVAVDIVDDVRGREPGKGGDQKEGQKDSLLEVIRYALGPASAWAQEATEISNATIRALKEKMKVRYAQMKPYYGQGVLEEKDDGYVAMSGESNLGLKEKRDLKNLVDAENKDRRDLYAEVAKALKIDPSQIDRVAEIFAKEWQKQ